MYPAPPRRRAWARPLSPGEAQALRLALRHVEERGIVVLPRDLRFTHRFATTDLAAARDLIAWWRGR
jgi:hypothetical protein